MVRPWKRNLLAILLALSSILSDAQDRGLVAQNVAHQRRSRNKKGAGNGRQKRLLKVGVDIPTLKEIRAIVAKLGGTGRHRPFLLTAIFTGLRASELRGLRWSDVDLAKGELHVRQGADRTRPSSRPASSSRRERPSTRACMRCATSTRHGASTGRPMAGSNCRSRWCRGGSAIPRSRSPPIATGICSCARTTAPN